MLPEHARDLGRPGGILRIIMFVLTLKSPAAVAVVGVAVMCILSGCDPAAGQGPISVRAGGLGLEVAVCAEIEIADAEAIVYQGERGEEQALIWEATGAAVFSYGDVVSLSKPPEPLVNVTYSPALLIGGDVLGIYLKPGVNSEQGAGAYANFDVPSSGMPKSDWLQSDGTLSSNPCKNWPDSREG